MLLRSYGFSIQAIWAGEKVVWLIMLCRIFDSILNFLLTMFKFYLVVNPCETFLNLLMRKKDILETLLS